MSYQKEEHMFKFADFLKFFLKKSSPKPLKPATDYDEYLLGDNQKFYSIADYEMDPVLTSMYLEIDAFVARIADTGQFDAGNANAFDSDIDSACQSAIMSLNDQYSIRKAGIDKMVAWRARDVKKLQLEIQSLEKEISRKIEALNYELQNSKYSGGSHNEK